MLRAQSDSCGCRARHWAYAAHPPRFRGTVIATLLSRLACDASAAQRTPLRWGPVEPGGRELGGAVAGAGAVEGEEAAVEAAALVVGAAVAGRVEGPGVRRGG